MNEPSSNARAGVLVLVAHPHDVVTNFFTIIEGSDVVCVTADRSGSLDDARASMGARRVRSLDCDDEPSFSELCKRIEDLAGERSYGRVYTHDPTDANLLHQDTVLVACKYFDHVWTTCRTGPLEQAYMLDDNTFRRKLEITNRYFGDKTRMHLAVDGEPSDLDCLLTPSVLSGIETFVRARLSEVVQAISLNHFGRVVDDTSDVWNFTHSAYELARYDATCALLERTGEEVPPRRIIEIGACEGLMTERIRTLFPEATIVAVEPNPTFLARLHSRLDNDPEVIIDSRSFVDVPLESDVIVAAEVLYYGADFLDEVLDRLKARYLLTSYHGSFDLELAAALQRHGWQDIETRRIPACFEPVDGHKSPYLAQRVGATIRMWKNGKSE